MSKDKIGRKHVEAMALTPDEVDEVKVLESYIQARTDREYLERLRKQVDGMGMPADVEERIQQVVPEAPVNIE